MIYDTKTALVIRKDLLPWQMANVAAFLAGGLAGTHPHLMGEPYRDGAGHAYTALIREPVFIYGGTLDELKRTHARALSRELVPAIYIEPMFHTTKSPLGVPLAMLMRTALIADAGNSISARRRPYSSAYVVNATAVAKLVPSALV